MNLCLLGQVEKYPEAYDGSLDCVSYAITCAFNKRGTLLAVGCNDGRILIWDFITRGIAKIIQAHTHPVCSLSWSRNGFKLLSAGTDNLVCIWDILSGDSTYRFRFPSMLSKVQFNPRNNLQILVSMVKHPPVLLDLSAKSHLTLPLDDESQQDLNIVASFDRRGIHIYTGNARGKVLVFEVKNDMQLVASFRMSSTGISTSAMAVKAIEFARRSENFLVCAADRTIRIYNGDIVLDCGKDSDAEPIQKLQDLVNKTQWRKCCFSGDGKYVCAGSAKQHALYIWDQSPGNLVKILHGTKGEVLLDVVWHPIRAIVASVSSGVVSIWSHPHVENWSAFAPDFKELDDNVEYAERESEFDLSDEDRTPPRPAASPPKKKKMKKSEKTTENHALHGVEKDREQPEEMPGTQYEEEEDDEEIEVGNGNGEQLVDITGIEPIVAFLSSDDEDNEDVLLYLPTAPDIDDPDDPTPLNFPENVEVIHESPDNANKKLQTTQPKPGSPKSWEAAEKLTHNKDRIQAKESIPPLPGTTAKIAHGFIKNNSDLGSNLSAIIPKSLPTPVTIMPKPFVKGASANIFEIASTLGTKTIKSTVTSQPPVLDIFPVVKTTLKKAMGDGMPSIGVSNKAYQLPPIFIPTPRPKSNVNTITDLITAKKMPANFNVTSIAATPSVSSTTIKSVDKSSFSNQTSQQAENISIHQPSQQPALDEQVSVDNFVNTLSLPPTLKFKAAISQSAHMPVPSIPCSEHSGEDSTRDSNR